MHRRQDRRAVANPMHTMFKVGEFKPFRATRDFNFGEVENLKIYHGDVIYYDGRTVKIGNDEYNIQSARGAVKAKWLVPEDSEIQNFTPQRFINRMTPADSTKPRDEESSAKVIRSQDQVVGSLSQVREAATYGNRVANTEGLDIQTYGEGITVAKVSVPTEFAKREIGSQQKQYELELESSAKRDRTISSEELAKVAASLADDGELTEDELIRREEARVRAEMLRQSRRAQFGEESSPVEAHAPSEASEDEPEDSSSNVVRTSIGVDWDLGVQPWTRRVKEATERYGASKQILEAISEVEIEAVANRINKFIAKSFTD